MNRDELLPNKYERLCAEYNKLRTKYRDVKDTLNTYITENKKSVALLNEKDALIKKLEEECKALRLEFDHKYGGSGVSNTVTSDSPRTVSSANGTNSLNHTVHQSEYIASTACQSLCDQSENLQDLDQLISSFIKALSDWTDATQSTQKPLESKEVKNELIEQIARLETQVFDISLKYQMERRRHRMLENEHSSTMPNELPENDNDFRVLNPVNGANGNYSLMLDWMHDRIYSATEQAQYFAVRAAFLQDELLSLIPYMTQLAQQALHHRSENESLRNALKSLQDELNTTHSNALRQSTQMAEHVVNLTEELQTIRACGLRSPGPVGATGNGGGGISPRQSGLSSNKKGSIFNVLKR